MLEDIKEECHINAALVLRQRVLFEVHVPVAIKERVNGRDATAFALFEKTKVTRGAGSGSDIKHAPLEFEDFAPFVHKDAVEVFPPQYLFEKGKSSHRISGFPKHSTQSPNKTQMHKCPRIPMLTGIFRCLVFV